MSEIKFRIWDKVNRRWAKHICLTQEGKVTADYTEDYEVLFSTRLRDKTGRDIYEGDIIDGVNGSINRTPMPYRPSVVAYKDGAYNIPIWGTFGKSNYTHYIEVIGNIYENPELLKKEEQNG